MFDKIPTRPQIWGANETAPADSLAFMSNVCLPDADLPSFVSMVPSIPISSGLVYGFPYRNINSSEWQISGLALTQSAGLYAQPGILGYQSLLFPRAGKISLGPGINYLGSITPFSTRSLMLSDSSGTTQYVDGCNLRVQNYDPSTNEGMGSCNVSAFIEIFYLNEKNQPVTITKDNQLKLQLIRPSMTNYQGKEVLTSAFKSCSSSTTCGNNECCYNNRCWSKDLVTQCVDQLPVVGNQVVGSSCRSDYECASLCCDATRGACAPHNPSADPAQANYCSKSPGQQCVTKEFCRKDFVTQCKVTRTGLTKIVDGLPKDICTLRCNPVAMNGICLGQGVSSSCIPPAQPAVPSHDDVVACNGAVDP
jgi:hypothetical protein